jgi:hypothetical protein
MANPSPAENMPSSSTPPGNTGPTRVFRKLVTLGERPFAEQLNGNVEIKSAAIVYRRKAPAKSSQ